MHPFVNIFGRAIPTYSLCILAGILLACPALILLSKNFKVKIEDAIYSFLYALIGLIVGAKLLYLLTNISSLPSIIRQYGIQALLRGGFVIYGGLIGAFSTTYIYCRQFHLRPQEIFSLLITVCPLIQCCGRIGCLLAGCCYGLPYDGRFSVLIEGCRRFPIQAVSSALDLILFLFLLFHGIFSKRKNLQFPLYLILYSTGRFAIEFFRADAARGFFGPFSTSQWISLAFFAAGTILTIKAANRKSLHAE